MGSENDSGGSRFYASYGRSYADSIISSHKVVGPTDIFIPEGAEYIAIEHGISDQVTLYRWESRDGLAKVPESWKRKTKKFDMSMT